MTPLESIPVPIPPELVDAAWRYATAANEAFDRKAAIEKSISGGLTDGTLAVYSPAWRERFAEAGVAQRDFDLYRAMAAPVMLHVDSPFHSNNVPESLGVEPTFDDLDAVISRVGLERQVHPAVGQDPATLLDRDHPVCTYGDLDAFARARGYEDDLPKRLYGLLTDHARSAGSLRVVDALDRYTPQIGDAHEQTGQLIAVVTESTETNPQGHNVHVAGLDKASLYGFIAHQLDSINLASRFGPQTLSLAADFINHATHAPALTLLAEVPVPPDPRLGAKSARELVLDRAVLPEGDTSWVVTSESIIRFGRYIGLKRSALNQVVPLMAVLASLRNGGQRSTQGQARRVNEEVVYLGNRPTERAGAASISRWGISVDAFSNLIEQIGNAELELPSRTPYSASMKKIIEGYAQVILRLGL